MPDYSRRHAEVPNTRILEGPAERIDPYRDEYTLRSNRGVPFSLEDILNEAFGPEGKGWGFDTTDPRHAEINELEEVSHGPEFDLVSEGWSNLFARGKFETNDGVDISYRLEAGPIKPNVGNLVVNPDGRALATEEETLSRPHIRRVLGTLAVRM
jgi:hypothetical protein